MTTLKEGQINRIGRELQRRGGGVVQLPGGGSSGGSGGTGIGGSGGGGGSKPSRASSSSAGPPIPLNQRLAADFLAGRLQPEYEVVLDYNFGWNTRAHFLESIAPGSVIRFRIPAYSRGVIVGLTTSPRDVGYDDIAFGIYQSSISGVELADAADLHAPARVRIVRNGVLHTPVEPEVSEADELALADLAAGDSYNADMFPLGVDAGSGAHELRVFEDRVEYWIQFGLFDAPQHIYTANIPFSMWTLTAALYSGGDKVWDVEVTTNNNAADILLPKIGMFATDEADLTTASMTLPAIVASAEDFIESVEADMPLPAIVVLGGDDVTLADLSLPRVTMDSYNESDGLPVVDITIGYARAPKVRMQSYAVDITTAEVDLDLPKVAVFATDQAELTIARITLPRPYRVFSNDIDDLGRVDMVEFAYAIDINDGFEAYYLLWTETQGIVGLMSAAAIERALMLSEMRTTGTTLTPSEILQALLSSVMSASDVASIAGEPLEVWALHMDVMGSTRYEGFNFNSFATIDGVAYGASDAGIFRLDGNTDNGEDIHQEIDFGRLSFGTNSRKAMPYVYAGMAADGSTMLRVRADEKTYYYQVSDSTEGMKAHRFELGRGLRASFYDVKLISNTSAFDLHNIEFIPVELKRRL